MPPSFVVLLRDVAPSSWTRCVRVLAAVREVAAVPVTLLVVPRLHGQARDARFDDALAWRIWMGDELALHGYMHEVDRPADGGFSPLQLCIGGTQAEFHSLGCDEALQRLHAGIRWFSANGWPLTGFAAPRWVLGKGAWDALRLTQLRYVLTRHGVHMLARDEEMSSHRVVLRTRGAMARAVSLAWHALPGSMGQDMAPLVRLELAPDAADHRAIKLAWQRKLQHHLDYRQAHTVARVVHGWQPAHGRMDTMPTVLPKPSSARV